MIPFLFAMKKLETTTEQDELIVEKAIGLSIIEIALGSFLHGLKAPFSGQFLSLNQGLYLIKSTEKIENRSIASKVSFEISAIVAIMKSFSPAGKKFGPMISITSQGALFSLGVFIFGNNILGKTLGMILLSLWAFIQPFITYTIIYGSDFSAALAYFIKKLNKHTPVTGETIIVVAGTVIGIKIIIAILISLFSKKIPTDFLSNYTNTLVQSKTLNIKRKKHSSAFKGALSDLMKPFFLVSIILMIAFFLLSGNSSAIVLWKTLRAIGIAFIIFFMSRSKKVYDFFMDLSNKNRFVKRLFEQSRKAYAKIME